VTLQSSVSRASGRTAASWPAEAEVKLVADDPRVERRAIQLAAHALADSKPALDDGVQARGADGRRGGRRDRRLGHRDEREDQIARRLKARRRILLEAVLHDLIDRRRRALIE